MKCISLVSYQINIKALQYILRNASSYLEISQKSNFFLLIIFANNFLSSFCEIAQHEQAQVHSHRHFNYAPHFNK